MTMIFLVVTASILLNYGSGSPTSFLFNSDAINVEQAGPNNFGKYLSVSQQEHRMGSLTLENNVNSANRLPPVQAPINWDPKREDYENTEESHVYSYDDIPDYYDTREMFPHCTTMPSIKDQSLCGCCWSVSTASAFSDRLCIHSKGMINVNISINHITTCARAPGIGANGCHGGLESEAWNFIKNNGAVSGGDYGTYDGCQPFLIKSCGGNDKMPCDQSNQVMTPICRKNKCSNEWHQPEGKLYKANHIWTMPGNHTHPNHEIDIRREIYRNGPVTAAFKVYPPLFFYKSGIFQNDFTNWPVPNGGHSVRIVGWGVENKIPYWILANSWGKNWGEGGFFRMLRGINYCGIESYITGGIPDIPLDIN